MIVFLQLMILLVGTTFIFYSIIKMKSIMIIIVSISLTVGLSFGLDSYYKFDLMNDFNTTYQNCTFCLVEKNDVQFLLKTRQK